MVCLFRPVAAALLACAVPLQAQEAGEQAPKAEVVERNADGVATKVRVEGRVYDVCQGDQKDGCINPREAGLDFGTVPIDRWPGKPASEISDEKKQQGETEN